MVMLNVVVALKLSNCVDCCQLLVFVFNCDCSDDDVFVYIHGVNVIMMNPH